MFHIGMDPNIFQAGNFILTWHGFFSFVAVVISVILVARWARSEDIEPDVVYATAIWAIIGGILGARVIHVIDRWDIYSSNPAEILAIWSGGIALFGAIIGGLLAGVLYAKIQGYPIGKLADLAAPAILIGQTVGRIGDIINGEHIAKVTNLPWGFVYSHPDSLSYQVHRMLASHPVIVYEMDMEYGGARHSLEDARTHTAGRYALCHVHWPVLFRAVFHQLSARGQGLVCRPPGGAHHRYRSDSDYVATPNIWGAPGVAGRNGTHINGRQMATVAMATVALEGRRGSLRRSG